jgi:glycosyltransferase involved in cell wall biosynthesis
MRKFEICIANRGDSDNPKLWSGTPLAIKNILKLKSDTSYSILDWELNKVLLWFYCVIFSKIFFLLNSSREKWLSSFASRTITKKINKLPDQDFILFICDFFVPKKLRNRSRYALYTDSHVVEYLKYCSEDKRFFKNYCINDYNINTKEQLKYFDLVFTQNEWTRQGFIKDYKLDPSKVFNVGFGVNLIPYTGEKDYSKELLLIVLRKGTEEYKGLYLLLDAFKMLKKGLPQLQLAVVGTEQKVIIEGVTYYYNQPRETTVELFRQCTLYTMPAISEPNGVTYLEALANKAPIVGLNRFAVPEFSGNGEWGFTSEKEDPQEIANVIEYALSDKERLKKMGLKGQQFVMENYRWEIVVEKMLTEMKKVI